VSARIRILYLIDKMGGGGAQTHLRGLISGLDPERFAPELVCLIRGGVSADRLLESGHAVRILGLKRLYDTRGILAFLRLTAELRRRPPHVLHTYLSAANVFGAFAARLAGLGGLVTTRRDTGFGDGPWMQRALSRTSPWARRVVAVSDSAAEIARSRDRVPAELLEVITNGIDLGRFAPAGRRAEARASLQVPESARLLVCVGHLTRIKGIDVLIQAAERLGSDDPDLHVRVAGRGAEREALERQLAAAGLAARFRLLGHHDDIQGLLEAADLFVLPSRSEGQPNAVIEAMAMGLPVVATNVGGVPEVARHEVEALLVSPEDPAALADACAQVLADPGFAERLSRAGRQRARESFDVARMVERYGRLYEQVAAV